MATYQPGVCNIGRAEQRKRYAVGAVGLTIAAGLILFGASTHLLYYGLVFAALLVGFEGILQGYLTFCVGFAMKKTYDVSEDGTDPRSVDKPTAHEKDMARAKEIHAYAITAAFLVTLLYMIPTM